jgi:hypothetical protein
LVDILPNGNILKVPENKIITTYDGGTYAQLSSLTLSLGGKSSAIGDAAFIDANNILMVTCNRMWNFNITTRVETDVGQGLTSDKQTEPVK